NLPTLSRGIRTLEFFNPNTATDNTVLIAGGYDGVFQMSQPATAANPTWSALSGNLPHALVTGQCVGGGHCRARCLDSHRGLPRRRGHGTRCGGDDSTHRTCCGYNHDDPAPEA